MRQVSMLVLAGLIGSAWPAAGQACITEAGSLLQPKQASFQLDARAMLFIPTLLRPFVEGELGKYDSALTTLELRHPLEDLAGLRSTWSHIDSTALQWGLARIIVDGHLSSKMQAIGVRDVYREFGGSAEPILEVLKLTRHFPRTELALSAITGPLDPRHEATVLALGCGAAAELAALARDSVVTAFDAGTHFTIERNDSEEILREVRRLVGAERFTTVQRIADRTRP